MHLFGNHSQQKETGNKSRLFNIQKVLRNKKNMYTATCCNITIWAKNIKLICLKISSIVK